MASKYSGETKNLPFDETWKSILKIGIDPFLNRIETFSDEELQRRSIPQNQYFECYRLIFALCTQRKPLNFSAELYQKHSEISKHFCKKNIVPILSKINKNNHSEFLEHWTERWRKFKWVADGMRRFFCYLDKFYVKNKNISTIRLLNFENFKKIVFEPFQKRAFYSILHFIDEERFNGLKTDRILLRRATAVFEELDYELSFKNCQNLQNSEKSSNFGQNSQNNSENSQNCQNCQNSENNSNLTKIYTESFENKFLQHSKKFFQICGRDLAENGGDFLSFLEKIAVLSVVENDRAEEIMPPRTAPLLLQNLTDCMALLHYQTFVLQNDSCVKNLIEAERFEELSKAVSLYSQSRFGRKGIERIFFAFAKNIEEDFFALRTFNKVEKEKISNNFFNKNFVKIDGKNSQKIEKFVKNKQKTSQKDENFGKITSKRLKLEKIESEYEKILKLIEIFKRCVWVMQTVFKNDEKLCGEIRDQFSQFLRHTINAPLILARIFNGILVKRANCEEEYLLRVKRFDGDREIDLLIGLCDCLENKKLFEKISYYLTLERRANFNLRSDLFERKIVDAVNAKWEGRWFNLLKQIYQDVKDSKACCNRWHCQINDNFRRQNVTVFSAAICDKMASTDFFLPVELRQACDDFEAFYTKLYRRRILKWRFDLGRANIEIKTSETEKLQLNVTIIQMLILQQFDREEKGIEKSKLLKRLRLPSKLFQFHFNFLISKSTPILILKFSKFGKLIFVLNYDFIKKHHSNLISNALKIPPFYRNSFSLNSDDVFQSNFSGDQNPLSRLTFAPVKIKNTHTQKDFCDFLDVKDCLLELVSEEKTEPKPAKNMICQTLFKLSDVADCALIRQMKGEKKSLLGDLLEKVSENLAEIGKNVSVEFLAERIKELEKLKFLRVDKNGKICYVP